MDELMLKFSKMAETIILVYVKKSSKDIKQSRIRMATIVNSKIYFKLN